MSVAVGLVAGWLYLLIICGKYILIMLVHVYLKFVVVFFRVYVKVSFFEQCLCCGL